MRCAKLDFTSVFSWYLALAPLVRMLTIDLPCCSANVLTQWCCRIARLIMVAGTLRRFEKLDAYALSMRLALNEPVRSGF